MGKSMRFGRPRSQWRAPLRARLQVELLECRNLLSAGLTLTPLVQVSGPNPLGNVPANGKVFPNSEIEPQLAVDPTDTSHAVAIWQQDRYSGSGARALVVSVTKDADAAGGAHWSRPAAIPGFDASVPGSVYGRYSDPWVSFAPNGDLYAAALGTTLTGNFPSRSAILVARSTNGGKTWGSPTTLIDVQAPAGSDPIDLLNDKESVTADPTNARYAYVIWDRLNQPSDNDGFNAFHGFAFRGDTLFSRTTDGGKTWEPYQVLFAPQDNEQTIGHQIVVLPDGTLVDGFALLGGSGSQPANAGQNSLAVIRSTDHGATWSAVPIVGPDLRALEVTTPDTGAPVRTGEVLPDFAVDPANGNLYAVWVDGRFSNYKHNDVAFSMSTNGGLSWSDPIKVNQAPATLSDGNQQAFVPSVAVNSEGTVAVTYYDFRNNTPAAGVPTDYWLVHASGNLTDPASWASGEKRLTDSSFDLEKAPNTGRGYFLGDYEGLAAGGKNFYALFVQAGSGPSDPSNVWFRDPPPAADLAAGISTPSLTSAPVAFAARDVTPAPVANAPAPSVAVLTGAPEGAAASGLGYGFLARWSDPVSLAPTAEREARTTASPDLVALDQTFAAGVLGGEDGLAGLPRATSKAVEEADPLSDGSLADAAFEGAGSEG